MPRLEVSVECPVHDSFRVRQVAGMFDVPITAKARERFGVDLPDLEATPWRIGLIVGPSGSGKTTIARRLFGESFREQTDWPRDRAVIDAVGPGSAREITHLFTMVGFGSPPSWIKPYHVLSGGQRFRCDLVRAILETPGRDRAADARAEWSPILAFDEFTSVVDRNVARVASAAIAKAIHGGHLACRFVAVSCHYDVAPWLEPDWIIDMARSQFQRRCLRRPRIRLEIVRCRREAWSLFARHHYLSGTISPSARCYLALWGDEPVAFCATVTLIGARNRWRFTRLVVLPDYQGIGIGQRLLGAVAAIHRGQGHRINLTASHPAVVGHCRRSPDWRAIGYRTASTRRGAAFASNYRDASGRVVASFEYVGPPQRTKEDTK